MSEVRLINEKPPENQGFLELARPGFEPGQTEPKSLPAIPTMFDYVRLAVEF